MAMGVDFSIPGRKQNVLTPLNGGVYANKRSSMKILRIAVLGSTTIWPRSANLSIVKEFLGGFSAIQKIKVTMSMQNI